jgi:hypothetical protein
MSVFDINYTVLSAQLLPVRLRNIITKTWIKCLVTPVKRLYDVFRSNRDINLYTLAHNSQVVYLKATLNDAFDPEDRGILIEDGFFADPLFTYLILEDEPVFLGLVSEAGSTAYASPAVLYAGSETSLFGVGFVVKVPLAVAFDIARMQALVNKYRLPGRNIYTIVTY